MHVCLCARQTGEGGEKKTESEDCVFVCVCVCARARASRVGRVTPRCRNAVGGAGVSRLSACVSATRQGFVVTAAACGGSCVERGPLLERNDGGGAGCGRGGVLETGSGREARRGRGQLVGGP